MTLPDLLRTNLGGEDAVAEVPLGGEDVLVVSPTRTLVYRAEGLLSDESVEEYPHDAERVEVSDGRRKAKITLDYGLDGDRTLSVPSKRLDDALQPVLAGVLNAAGITGPGEAVTSTFRFSELTLVVTSHRVVKHVGAAVWDSDFEEFHYEDVSDLSFEQGSLATSVVLRLGSRQERFKAPNEESRAVREAIVAALCAFYEVGSLEEFRLTVAADEGESAEAESASADFGEGPAPLDTGTVDLGMDAADATDARPADAAPDAAEQTVAPTDLASEVGIDLEAGRDAGRREETRAEAEVASGGAAVAAAGDEREAGEKPQTDPFEESPFEPVGAVDEGALVEQVAALTEAVDRQREELDRQSALIERLIAELRQGR